MDPDRARALDGDWRRRLYVIIFESETPAGRLFDKWLIVAILASVAVVFLHSVEAINERYGGLLDGLEWFFTVLFTVEYLARLLSAPQPWRYARSFFGIVDLLSTLPTYLALLYPPTQFLVDIRILRLMRVLRIFKLTAYLDDANLLRGSLVRSRRKITVFVSAVLMIIVILGTLMYVIEGPDYGFTSIPTSIYWAVVTVTTVGYGDVTPHTPLGQLLATFAMLLDYGILAVPTGIVTAEFTVQSVRARTMSTKRCKNCLSEGHDSDAKFCKDCGAPLET